jgi:hypothetical protein
MAYKEISENDLLLQRDWTLWFDAPNLHTTYEATINPLAWKQNINKVYTFNNIANFWRLYSNIINPEEMWYRSAYYLFVDNTDPHCLDLNNQNGITLHFILSNESDITTAWLHTMLTLISESMEYIEYANGISLKKHKNFHELTLWLKINDDELTEFLTTQFTKLYEKNEIKVTNTYTLTLAQKFGIEKTDIE